MVMVGELTRPFWHQRPRSPVGKGGGRRQSYDRFGALEFPIPVWGHGAPYAAVSASWGPQRFEVPASPGSNRGARHAR